MKKTIYTLFIFIILKFHPLFLIPAFSQIMLTNYTYSPNKSQIGKLTLTENEKELPKPRLKGENARYFSIDNQNNLVIKKNALKESIKKWYDIEIEYKTSQGLKNESIRVVKDEFIINKVIAHRGAWKNTGVPENSIAALQHAIRMGCEGSEFDVHMSSDSVPFVNHDPTIFNLTIDKTPAKELSELILSNRETLPTLEEYLKEGIKQNNTKLILEIKASALGKERSLALTDKVVKLVQDLKAQAWVDYISFDYDVCLRIMELAPYAKVAYLNGDKTPAQLAADNFYGLDYHYNVMQKNEHWLREAHENKLTVNVWTVNDEEMMDWLLERNLDYITTNEPELLLKKVNPQ
ncbi:hypothetical protein BH23BAC1_BH23BAC1_08940 [soil metagenome]